MHPRSGVWLIAAAGLVGLALAASAQTRPATMAAAPPAAAPAKPRAAAAAPARTQPSGFMAALSSAMAQIRAAAVAAAPPAKASTPTPGPTPLPVNGAVAGRLANTAANATGRKINARFISANAAAINSVQIPVLLPSEPDLAANLRIFPNGAFYTVSSKSNGMSFVLTGAGRAFPVSPVLAKSIAARIPADGIVIDGSEGGLNASFSRFGAAYSISLECATPLTDPRCTNPAYIRGLIGRLMVVMPGSAS